MYDPRELLHSLFMTAVQSADPMRCIPPLLPPPPAPGGRTLILGAGKASAAMARAVEQVWLGDLSGLVVTRYGYAVPTRSIEIVEASHPVPDRAGMEAARRILDMAKGLTKDDLVICLISGGGSALLALPAEGITLEDKQSINKALLRCGATISEINCVRRHLSAIKGGRLAAACHPARVVTMLISDVPALAILARYQIDSPASLRDVLEGGRGETVKPGDPRLGHPDIRMIAAPLMALEAAAEQARSLGLAAHILGDDIEGEAREVGTVMAGIARLTARRGKPFTPPCVLLSGGETTVTVRGNGKGGRNVEFLLSLGLALAGDPRIHAIAGDTDGVDGTAEIAGAYLAPDSLARARKSGINPLESLANNDGHGFFSALGDSVVTGPTLTNVNDFRAILIV
jgi:hydroxypyruvate reductase